MSIYIDISAAVHRRAGLGRYASELVRALAPQCPGELALFYNCEDGIEALPALSGLPERTVSLGYKPWRMLVWLGQVTKIGFNRLLPDAKLFHATEHLLMPLHGVPTVLTVHDLIFRHLARHHKPLNRWYLNMAMPLFCRRATHLIAISECTRQDLVAHYGVPPEKISVIYEAADARFRTPMPAAIKAARRRYSLPERYVLFVGTIEPRKNLNRLLQAFEVIWREKLTDGLVIVGERGWLYEDFFAALERSPARSAVIFPGFVPDEDLPAVYGGAQVMALPSLYEGFGLPVLEAMACGAPVVCSNTSSLPEVAGEAALLADPESVDELRSVLSRVLGDESLRQEMRSQGIRQAARFSWERTARETLAVYRQAMAAAGS